MSTVTTQSKPKERMKMNERKNKHHKGSKAPHEEVFGRIIGLTVWSIIADALFYNAWWAIIVNVVLGIGLFGEIIKFLADGERRKQYPYDTKLDDLTGIIIGAVVVNVVMRVFFPYQWWAEIPSSVLIILVIQNAYGYYMTEKRLKREKLQGKIPSQPTAQVQQNEIPGAYRPSGQNYSASNAQNKQPPHESYRTYYAQQNMPAEQSKPFNPSEITRDDFEPFVKPSDVKPVAEKNKKVSYCPICGLKREERGKFCPGCGYKYE